MNCLFIAWRYVRFHWGKTTVLVASITLMIFLPAGLEALVSESAEQLRRRAAETPLIVGARGSDVDLVLNTLYFDSEPPVASSMSQVERIRRTGLASAVPLYVRFRAKGRPIVGTTVDYFDARRLSVVRGRMFALLGECVLGYEAAEALNLSPGQTLISTPESAFDLAGVYPLKMHVVGVLEAAGTPDDSAVFVDMKTAWIIQGLGHGHRDLAEATTDDQLLERDGNRLTANPSVLNYTEIDAGNVDSFHFHGDVSDFPITAVIAVPRDEKSLTLLMGRYQSLADPARAVRPSSVMDDLLGTVLRVRDFMIAGALLLTTATVSSVVLVFVLSLRLRRRELVTLAKIGCSRARIVSVVACEILLVILVSILLAGGMTMVARRFGESAIRWFLL